MEFKEKLSFGLMVVVFIFILLFGTRTFLEEDTIVVI
jgi:hypothetical protein